MRVINDVDGYVVLNHFCSKNFVVSVQVEPSMESDEGDDVGDSEEMRLSSHQTLPVMMRFYQVFFRFAPQVASWVTFGHTWNIALVIQRPEIRHLFS